MQNKNPQNIEVELRGLMSEEKYHQIIIFLSKKASHITNDSKISYFFVVPKGILKISNQSINNTAKISYKDGNVSKNILMEYEIQISPDDTEKGISMFKSLGFKNVNEVRQDRINFKYKGAEIAIKITPDFGPHFEIEMMARDKADAVKKRMRIQILCNELGLEPLTRRQMDKLVHSINKKHGFLN